MGATIGARLQLKRESTQYWNEALGFIPLEGEIIIYNDYSTIQKEVDGVIQNIKVPAIKIGDGTSYLIDMPFTDDAYARHILDTVVHITAAERESWNNKVRCFIDPENAQNIVFTTD